MRTFVGMNDWAFWNEWKTRHRVIYLVLLAAFGVSLAGLAYSWLRGADVLVGWRTEGNVEALPMAVDEFTRDFFTFRIDVDAYLITQVFKAGAFPLQIEGMYLTMGFWLFGLTFLLAAITYIRKPLWFAIAMVGGASFFLAAQFPEMSAPLDDVRSQDPNQYFTIVSLVAVLGLAYLFQSFLTRSTLLARLLAFGLLISGLGYYFLEHYAAVGDPVFAVGNFMMVAPVLLSLVFIVFNAHEIPHTLTYFITNSGQQGNNFRHFIIAMIVYVLNLAYAFAVSIKAVEPELLYFSPFAIYIITVILGIWGVRQRRDRISHILNFDPFGAVLFMALAIITNATLGYAFLTDNDPIIEVFEDVILFSHISMAIAFLGYVFTNFANQLQFNLPIYRIIWSPRRLDFIFFFGLGIIIMLIFGLRNEFFTRYQVWAGYYNGLADVFKHESLPDLSKRYYELSLGYDYQSHRANYQLARLYTEENNKEKALFFFEQALLRDPLPQTYARLAEMNLLIDRFQDATWALEDGVGAFPGSGELRNNLAMLYHQGGQRTAALRQLEIARQSSRQPQVPETNRMALLAGGDKVDSLAEPQIKDAPAVLSNALIGRTRNNEVVERPFQPKLVADSVLETSELCYLYHRVLNRLSQPDSGWATRMMDYASVPENTPQQAFLQTAAAMRFYADGNVREAYQLMDFLWEQRGDKSSVFANVLAYWLFEHGQYEEAVRHFEYAMQRGHQTGQLERALALSELSDKKKARLVWQIWSLQENHPYQSLGKEMLRVFDHPKDEVPPESWSENDVYRLLYYFPDSLDDTLFNQLFDRLQNPDLKVRALARKLRREVKRGDTLMVKTRYGELDRLLPTLDASLTEKQQAQLRALDFLGDYAGVEKLLPDFQPKRAFRGWKTFFKARLAAHENDTLAASQYYQNAINQLPFETAVYEKGVAYYLGQDDLNEAYQIALAGVQVAENNPHLQQLYALVALKAGFPMYAENAVEKLAVLLSESDYKRFLMRYDEEKKRIKAEEEAWQFGG